MTLRTLYHGTTRENADRLLAEGWRPFSGQRGGNCGQTRYLYLTNEPENARWFAEAKGGDVVLTVSGIPEQALDVDPEDGISDTVDEELSRSTPGSVVLKTVLPAASFSEWRPVPTP